MDLIAVFLCLICLQLSSEKAVEQPMTTKLQDAIQAYQNFFDTQLPPTLTSDTAAKIIRPRCGKPGSVQESSRTSRWRKKNLTFKIVDNLPGFTRNDSIMIIKNAIDAWSKSINLMIEETTNPDEIADIQIYSEHIDGPGFRLGYAYYPNDGGVHLDKEEMWSLYPQENNYDGLDINWVVRHELGHSLGLKHSPDENSVMYPYYDPTVISQVTKENINHLIDLYGVKQMNNNLLCDNTGDKIIDSIFLSYTNERIVFKNRSYWIFSDNGLEFGPFDIGSYLHHQYQIPEEIDAIITIGKTTYFFKDDVFYKFTSTNRRFLKKPIRSFDGFNVKKLDAAFYYRKQRMAYFFKGSQYYSLNFKKPIGYRLENNGDLIKKDWIGIPDDLDAADLLTDDSVMFVKKHDYYVFNLVNRTLERGPLDIMKDFLKCTS